jgi:GNAT superfamily N-acetyltransferase
MTNKTPKFYSTLGPFLARREIAKELGSPTWDDDGLTWFVAKRFVARKGSVVLGFCALDQDGEKAELRSSYVRPEYRKDGVYTALFEARIAAIQKPCRIRSVVRAAAVPVFKKHGFRETKKTKNFHTMERDL